MGYQAEARGGVEERARMARKHIFILDAEPTILDLVRALLEEEHYNVTSSNYVASTHAVIAVMQPDLVILDLVWGQQAGWDLLEELAQKASTAGIPVLLTSTDQRLLAEAAANPARFGTHRDMIKPFDVEDLVRTVHELAGPA
jgi:DNA-binding NtrC family response regulator